MEYQSKGDKGKILLPEECINMNRPYLSYIINEHKTQEVRKVHSANNVTDYETTLGEWKIQLTMSINFISSKDDSDETCHMRTKSDNIEIVIGSETNEIIEELFKSFLQRYQEGLEESRKGSQFNFDSIDLLYYHLQKPSLKRTGSSYIDSPKWLKNKRATINPKNNNNNCFQYSLTAALRYQNIKSRPEWVSNLKPFIDKYDWEGINFPPKQEKDWKKIESNNKSIGLNILFATYNTEEIRLEYVSKHNHKCENQVILLINTEGKKWDYLDVKSLSALFRGITSKHDGDFYCLNCFHSYSTKNKLKNMKERVMIMIIVM